MDYIGGLSTSFSWTKSIYLTEWAHYSICKVMTVAEGLGCHLWWSRPWRWECRRYIQEEVMRQVWRKEPRGCSLNVCEQEWALGVLRALPINCLAWSRFRSSVTR